MQSGGINLFSRKVAIRLQLELLSTKLAYQPGLRGGAAGWVPVGFLRLLLRTEPGGCVSGGRMSKSQWGKLACKSS